MTLHPYSPRRRAAAGKLSPAVWVAGPGVPAPPEGAWVKSWPSAAGQRKAPLVAAWRRCHIRGDSRAKKSPPCAKGGQHGNAMQGGLTALNPRDDTRCRVWLSLVRCRQSLSRRSPTAPFAQGRSGGRTAILSLVRCPDGHTFFAFLHRTCPARERSMGAEALRQPLAKTRKSGLSHFFDTLKSPVSRRLFCVIQWISVFAPCPLA